MKRIFAVVLLNLSIIGIHADEFKHGDPESVGMSSERLERVTAVMQDYIDNEVLAGIHVLIARKGTIVFDMPLGTRGMDDDRPLTKDALYRIFSMTKPVTAVAAMQLYEQGEFKLTDPVAAHIPEFAELKVFAQDGEHTPVQNPMTMRHLLTHTAGLGYGLSAWHAVDRMFRQNRVLGSENLDEMATKLKSIPLKFEPGARWDYSAAVDVTGLVVQRLSGQGFDEYLEQEIFEPLGMVDTFFQIPEEEHARLLPNHNWAPGEEEGEFRVVMRPVGENEYRSVTFYSGGGGLISTGMDYLRFAEMLRAGGELEGARILSPLTIDYMTQNHLPVAIGGAGAGEGPTATPTREQRSSFGFGLGFGVNTDPVASGHLSSPGEYYWGGAAGTIFWVDPVEELVVVGMIQLMGGSGLPLRNDLKIAVLQSIVD